MGRFSIASPTIRRESRASEIGEIYGAHKGASHSAFLLAPRLNYHRGLSSTTALQLWQLWPDPADLSSAASIWDTPAVTPKVAARGP
jgi:hypothetical protein